MIAHTVTAGNGFSTRRPGKEVFAKPLTSRASGQFRLDVRLANAMKMTNTPEITKLAATFFQNVELRW
jgi:hypothetical protein